MQKKKVLRTCIPSIGFESLIETGYFVIGHGD